MNYVITERIFHAYELGGHTKRKRMAMIASMKGPIHIPESVKPSGKVINDLLELSLQQREWLTEETDASIATFLRRERENQKPESQKNFGIGRVRATDTITPTITKYYQKRQMTQPILVKEEDGVEYFSWFTPRELARINGIPESYELPQSKTTACEIIGQGVDCTAFHLIAEAIKVA
jgi:site-specific DNA-cytosine methylase